MKPIAALLGMVLLCTAADKEPPAAHAENDRLSISATLLAGDEAVTRELGYDLDGNITLVRVEITPKGDEGLNLVRDDFLLRSRKDGQRCGPLHPSQIAGRAALVISSRPGGGIAAEQGGPVWGPGPGGSGQPRRLPGNQTTMGSASGASEAQATVISGSNKKEDPVLAVLKKKVLPEKEIKASISGLLYFSLEGKHKPKQLALQYNGPAGKLTLEFR